MYYGAYKNLRGSAWACFEDFKIDRLPVDILKIARNAGVRTVRNSKLNVLDRGTSAKSFYDGKEWIIVYDDTKSKEESRYSIAHELGHIFLGHELVLTKYAGVQYFKELPVSEKQADMFAVRLLCPACVLWGLALHSAEDIAKTCLVDLSVAEKRAKRMNILYKRNKFLTDPAEERVYMNFSTYIQDCLWKRAIEEYTNKK